MFPSGRLPAPIRVVSAFGVWRLCLINGQRVGITLRVMSKDGLLGHHAERNAYFLAIEHL